MTFKNFLGNIISKISYKILKMLGANLPKHVALNIIKKEDNYLIHDQSLILKTDLMRSCEDIYEESLAAIDGYGVDNFSKRIRHYTLYQIIDSILKKNINDLAIAECGCWKGQSAFIIATAIKNNGSKNNFYIFDSFEGLSEYSPYDKNNISDKSIEETRKHFAFGIDLVKSNLKIFDFINYFKGWIPSRFKEVEEQKFCFVNIDVDLYEPIKDSLEFFFPRLISGGCIFLDDYGFKQFPGASKAIDDFIKLNRPSYFVALPTGGAYLIK
jgi:O-methyltransferase